MKKLFFVLILISVFINLLTARLEMQTFTTQENGITTEMSPTNKPDQKISAAHSFSRDSRLSTLWQTSDAGAIAGEICVAPTLQNSFVQWHLNNERVSLFHDNSTPLWEHSVSDLDFGYPIDMLEEGTLLAVGDGHNIKIFDPNSANPVWQHTIGYNITGLQLSPDGLYVYIAYYDDIHFTGIVEKFEIDNSSPLWTADFEGGAQTLDLSGDGSTLIFTQYGGGNSNMWVLDSDDGTVIFQGPEYNQNSPAISDDASLIVNGDYSGMVQVYEYNPDQETYEEKWTCNVSGNGTSTWVGGMSISGDGSTIAVGTLIFLPNDNYDGEIFVFNSDYPIPLWTYQNCGDYVTQVDMSNDGSLIGAAGYGPINNNAADFFLFRKESNIPIYEINTPGSMYALDVATDGSFCTVGGKAVHARIMGSGGLVYSVECDLGGGHISGLVNLEGEEDNSGAKIVVTDLIDYFAYSDVEGNFTISNIPAGTYTVEFSKVGYVPVNIEDVSVVDNQTNDLGEVTLDTFGSPPLNLTASQASGLSVELSWEEPASGTIDGYNIYRKQYQLMPYPEEPFASVASDVNAFSDQTALPLKDYYYVVTAIIGGSFQSPYSNEAIGWISTGFIVDEISVYEGNTPTIDGIITEGEWDDAFRLDTSDFWGAYDNTVQPVGSVIGYFKMNDDMTELYVAYINYNDTVLEDHDEVALYMDDNNDGIFSLDTEANEGNFWAAYYSSGNQLKFRPIYNTGGVGDIFYLPDPQLEVSVAAGYLVYEFMIPIGSETWEINPSAENQSGLAIFVLDDNTPDASAFDGWWPLDNTNLFAPDGFGTITYGAVPQTPPAPGNLTLEENNNLIYLSWEMPTINDFDHFNIYSAVNDESFELLTESYGTTITYAYENIPFTTYKFYLTTVNQQDMESEASEIVQYTTVDSDENTIPLITALNGNHPNPFNPSTNISFSVAQPASLVSVEIFNIKGQKVKMLVNDIFSSGVHTLVWNGKDDNNKQAASGIYFYKMKCGDFQNSRKMLLLK
ncbi:MAG: carboxypeptidase regulatory-like domain-containing protein [Candidatus Cloacimonetes bacterium]|nr:carboxypeptidase regulatory-like domain-containing protein [Candidatus Cloacimonadota bacterium]